MMLSVSRRGSAIHKCRAAFLALALCMVGPPAAAVDGSAARGGLESRFVHFDGTGIVKPLREFTAGEAALLVWQRFDLRRWRVRVDLQRTASLSQLQFVDGDASVGFDRAIPVTSLHVQVAPPSAVATLALGVHVPDEGVRKPGFFMSVWLQPVHMLGFGLDATTPPEWPRNWTATVDGEGGTLVWNSHTIRTHWRTDFTPTKAWRVSGQLQQDRIVPGNKSDDQLAEFSMRPSGFLLRRTLEVEREFLPVQLRLGFCVSNGDLTSQIHAYTEGARFGQLGVLEATWTKWQFTAVQHSSRWAWSGLVSHGSANLISSGVIKFWPFSEGLVSLLGSRRHLELTGSASWWQLGSQASRNLGTTFELGAGIDLYRMYPEAMMFSWQPLVFGMGITDPQTSRLNLTRIDLAAVQLRCGVHFTRRIMVSGALKQWLPLGLEKSKPAVHQPEATAPTPRAANSDSFRFGTGLVVSAGLVVGW